MKIKEEEEERDFYARRGIELKPEYATQEVKTYTSRGSGKVNVSTVVSDICFGDVSFVIVLKQQNPTISYANVLFPLCDTSNVR